MSQQTQDVRAKLEAALKSLDEKPPVSDQQALVNVVQTMTQAMVDMHTASLEQFQDQFDRLLTVVDEKAGRLMLSVHRRRGAGGAGLSGHQPTTTGGADGTPSAVEREAVDGRDVAATLSGLDPQGGFTPIRER